MKSNAIVCAIAAATLGFGSMSYAQTYRNGPDNQSQPRAEQRGPGGPGWQQGRPDGRFDNRPGDRGDNRFDNRRQNDFRNDRGPGYANARGPQFHRGGHIPNEYRSRQYVVNDWRGHRLAPPPRGQQWVQVGSDYALIAIATGLIASIVLSQ